MAVLINTFLQCALTQSLSWKRFGSFYLCDIFRLYQNEFRAFVINLSGGEGLTTLRLALRTLCLVRPE